MIFCLHGPTSSCFLTLSSPLTHQCQSYQWRHHYVQVPRAHINVWCVLSAQCSVLSASFWGSFDSLNSPAKEDTVLVPPVTDENLWPQIIQLANVRARVHLAPGHPFQTPCSVVNSHEVGSPGPPFLFAASLFITCELLLKILIWSWGYQRVAGPSSGEETGTGAWKVAMTSPWPLQSRMPPRHWWPQSVVFAHLLLEGNWGLGGPSASPPALNSAWWTPQVEWDSFVRILFQLVPSQTRSHDFHHERSSLNRREAFWKKL